MFSPSEKYMDFCIRGGNKKYSEFNWFIVTRAETGERSPHYPENCSHYISMVEYGADLVVHVPKIYNSIEMDEVSF